MLDGQRAAIVLLSAIGDIVHALPLMASIRAAVPRARLEWFVQGVPAQIARHHPAIDRVWTLDRHRGWRGFRDLGRRVRGERFDLVLDLQVYGKASLVTALLSAPRKLGFDRGRARELNWLVTNERIPTRPAQHVCEQYLEFADHLRMPRRYEWALPVTFEERTTQRAFYTLMEAPLAAFVVGTTRPQKEWSADRWARLAEALHADLGYRVCIAGGDGPRERACALEVARRARCPILDARRHDLRRLLWLLDGAALAISPDTGPYHLAVALAVPTIGLFGATDPSRHGPNRRFPELVVDAYHDPGEAWHPPRAERRSGRMTRITVDEVLAKAVLARARYPRAVNGPARPSAEEDPAA